MDRRTPSRSFRINSDAPCSVRLTMFAHAHANSSKRGSFGFSGTRTATMQKPNPIPSLIRRQYEPEVQAAIWRSREVDLNGVHRHHKPAGVVFIRPPSKPTYPLVRRMPQKTQPAFSPPRPNEFKFIPRAPSRISGWVSDMFPHWASYVGWCVCLVPIPTENPPTAPVPHRA